MDTETFRQSVPVVLGADVLLSGPTATAALCTAARSAPPPGADGVATALSARERAVLAHLAAGRTRGQIARAEQLSRRTVERIIADLEARLEAPTPFILGLRAAQLGYLAP